MADENRERYVRINHMRESEIAALLDRSEDAINVNDDFGDEESDGGDEDYELEVEDEDVSDDDIESDTNDVEEISENTVEYLNKDRDIKWVTTPPGNRLSRATTEQIIHRRTGVTSFAVHRISGIKDAFDLCMTQAMKKDVIHFSNMQGNRVVKHFENIDEIEFDAYLGLLLLIGVYRSYGESIKSLWDELHGRPMLRAVMSVERFFDISRVLAFDDRQGRRSEARGDKLAPIRDFYEKWTENLQLLYVPNENITVDEQLIPFRGRCPFKVYMPSKPGKYGMKAWIAADSELGEHLVRPCIVRRNRLPRAEASAAIVRNIRSEESIQSSSSSPPSAKILKASDRKRCKFCPLKHVKKTFTACSVCNKPVCPTHRHSTVITTTYCEQHIP